MLLENFRPGVMARLGLGYRAVQALQPDIVYCSVSGYGQSGPLRDWPAIDNIVQATSGMMSLGGEPGDPPMRVGFPVVDTLTGQTAAFAILAALLRRANAVGEAQLYRCRDVRRHARVHGVGGRALSRHGQGAAANRQCRLQRAADVGRVPRTATADYVSLGVVQQHQFERLARLLDRPGWLEDARFANPHSRLEHAAALITELDVVIAMQSADYWESLLSAAGIPCGRVREVGEAVSLPHLATRGLKLPVPVPGFDEPVSIVNAGFCMNEAGPHVAAPPPRLDEHRDEILRWIGGTTG